MRRIDLQFGTRYAELAGRRLDRRFATDRDPDGCVEAVTVGGRRYWYFATSAAGQLQRRRPRLVSRPRPEPIPIRS